MHDSELLELMIAAALEAGAAAHDIFRGDLKLAHKKDNSPVTAADHAAEAIILQRLGAHCADIPIIAEEEVAAGRVPAIGPTFFLVDPLDGTREFVAGRPEFTVNIALVRAGTPMLGVVYAPAAGALFGGDVAAAHAFRATAAHGGAAAGARTRIHVRPAPPAGLTAVASRSHASPETRDYLKGYKVANMVSIGSSLKFCWVASGEADVYPRLGTTMEWDTAAGHAVLLAAGGSVVSAAGGPLLYGKPGFTNPWFIATGSVAALPVP
ncbi:MAG TPA: 3'(2'),5'-bisphosphate nucleotidase CysQ [Steroidobacteraceae bacterium]|nr:3'(2'),5'-bisphosphate nucleotidase CysQ [Steroidobacteraceae bacterium]